MENISTNFTDFESRLYCSTKRENMANDDRIYCKSCENVSSSFSSSSSSSSAATMTMTISCTKLKSHQCSPSSRRADSFPTTSNNFAHSYATACPIIDLRFFYKSSSHLCFSLSVRHLCTFLLLCSFVTSSYGCGPGRGIGGARRNRKLTPLVFKQHVPNMSEKTLGASGLNEGPIDRDSPKFKDLVPNYNKDIIFKDEEGTGADRLMTRRCKEKLNTLAVSVMNQWPGVRLRVTESWEEERIADTHSLHYEGRAVDITTSDRDRAKYGMLARLAVEAGFDWVYYESRAHIHCSVKSDASHIPHMNGCFTPDSTVMTANGERKKLQDVTIGDRLLSMTKTGATVFSEVILFMDRDLELSQEFVQLRTESGNILTVTPAHLIMIWKKWTDVIDYTFADRIEEGDYLFVEDATKNGHLRPDRVVELRAVLRKGVVAPLTMEGTIIVDSVAASCYAVVNSQSLAHWSLAPMRFMAMLKSWMPSSSSTCHAENETCKIGNPKFKLKSSTNKTLANSNSNSSSSPKLRSTAQVQNGVHWYTKALFNVKDFVLPKDWRYQ